MCKERPYCLSIAGFDPSAGAGVLADIKAFEQLGTYGLGVVSAITYQNENTFDGLKWMDFAEVKKQIAPLLNFSVKTVKIGLIKNPEILARLVDFLTDTYKDVFVIWDPVLKASTGFCFHEEIKLSESFLNKFDLITPNFEEYKKLGFVEFKNDCAVLLKGGHRNEEKGTDTLFLDGMEYKIHGEEFANKKDKHGTGCVLSSAIAAYVSLGYDIIEACKKAKKYVEGFILSNAGKLGYHKI